jgi:hypothetical protein
VVVIETLLNVGKFAYPKAGKERFLQGDGKKIKKMLKTVFTNLPLYIVYAENTLSF